ncbi:MAG TPA: hypothetical protein VHX42_03455, partial [Candidatus Babeliales bacterium]|nr:hypothetical protein [Candidatus Babeliales bacterium]
MKKNLLCVAGAIIIVVIFIGLRKNSAPLVSTKTYQCIQMHDTILSDEYFSAINNTVENLCKEHCAAHIIIDRLKKDFLALNKVVIAYQPSGTRVMISAHEPQCCLNNSVILTTHKELLPKNVFTEDAIADIPNIMCHLPLDISSRARPEPVEGYLGALENPSTNSGRAHREQMGNNVNIAVLVSSLLQKLPSDIYQTYNLELIHEHCLHFSYKQQPQFTILSSV